MRGCCLGEGVLTGYKVLVIASIHQPSTTTFELFDKLMLLSRGKIAYNGPVSQVKDYFASLGHEVCIIYFT
jgi:ABC-type multidrug transport system ATPase subunit